MQQIPRASWILAILGCALAIPLAAAWSADPEKMDTPHNEPITKLVVATRHSPPFAMKNEDGQWIGISIELLREIKADLESEAEHETELEFQEMELEKMLDAVERGEVDLAAAALTVNYDREKRMDFTHPFHSSGLGIAVSGGQVRGWDGVMSAIFSLTFQARFTFFPRHLNGRTTPLRCPPVVPCANALIAYCSARSAALNGKACWRIIWENGLSSV